MHILVHEEMGCFNLCNYRMGIYVCLSLEFAPQKQMANGPDGQMVAVAGCSWLVIDLDPTLDLVMFSIIRFSTATKDYFLPFYLKLEHIFLASLSRCISRCCRSPSSAVSLISFLSTTTPYLSCSSLFNKNHPIWYDKRPDISRINREDWCGGVFCCCVRCPTLSIHFVDAYILTY